MTAVPFPYKLTALFPFHLSLSLLSQTYHSRHSLLFSFPIQGEDYKPCAQFLQAYNSLCPNAWVSQCLFRHHPLGGPLLLIPAHTEDAHTHTYALYY